MRDWPERVRIGQEGRMGSVASGPVRVGIVGIPEAGLVTLSGIFDVLNSPSWLAGYEGLPASPTF